LGKVYDHLQDSDSAIDKLVQEKEDEITFLNGKLAEFENVIKKYADNLIAVKSSYDKSITDYKKALYNKAETSKAMKDHYEHIVKDVISIDYSSNVNLRIL
jgi:hypothetical protein